MAAIIDFPRETAVWRRRRNPAPLHPAERRGQILIFDGVRYSRESREAYAEEYFAETEALGTLD